MADHTLISAGTRPYTVSVYERGGRNDQLYARFRYRGEKCRLPLGFAARINGRVVPQLQRKAADLAERMNQALERGEHPATVLEEAKPMTLEEAWDRYLDPETGRFRDPSTTHARNLQRARRRTCEILGRRTPLEELSDGDLVRVAEALAKRFRRIEEGGLRSAEVIISALHTMLRWAKRTRLARTVPRSEPGWKRDLAAVWEEAGNEVEAEPSRPRHTRAETARIYANLHRADPRIATALMIGGEFRVGQVLRVRRAHLGTDGETGMTIVEVPGRGKKKPCDPIFLAPEQQAWLDLARETGYLANLERAYRERRISDYPLFPGGRLKGVRAKLSQALTPLTESGARRQFQELEKAAGVQHVSGRGWYGVRRTMTDLTDDLEDVLEEAKDAAGGWKNSTMRKEVYRKTAARDRHRRAAAQARGLVREQLRNGAETGRSR